MTRSPSSRRAAFVPLTALLALFAVLLAPAALAQGDETLEDLVTFEVTTFRVDLYRNADGETVEQLVEVSEARAGQEIEYRVTASNDGDRIYRPGELFTTLELPEGTAFVEGSAGPQGDDFRVRLSSDGGTTFEEAAEVAAENVNAVEWTYLERFEPGDEITVHYRVTVL